MLVEKLKMTNPLDFNNAKKNLSEKIGFVKLMYLRKFTFIRQFQRINLPISYTYIFYYIYITYVDYAVTFSADAYLPCNSAKFCYEELYYFVLEYKIRM